MSRQDRLNRLELTELNTDDSKGKSTSVWEKVQIGDIVNFHNESIGVVTAIYPECAYPNSFIIRKDSGYISAGSYFVLNDKFNSKEKVNMYVNHKEISGIVEKISSYITGTEIIFRLI